MIEDSETRDRRIAETAVRYFVNRLMWYDPEWGVYRAPDKKFTRSLIDRELTPEAVEHAVGKHRGFWRRIARAGRSL